MHFAAITWPEVTGVVLLAGVVCSSGFTERFCSIQLNRR